MSVDLDTSEPPFSLLPAAVQAQLKRAVDVIYFASGATVLEAGSGSPAVYVLIKGHIAALSQLNDEVAPFGDLGAGDILGALAVLIGRARFTYQALESTICYAIPAQTFRNLCDAHADFAAWFQAGLSAKRKLRGQHAHPEPLNRLMVASAADAPSAPLIYANAQTTIADAVATLREHRVSCLFIDDADGLGIVTRTDLLNALALEGLSPSDSIGRLVRRPVRTIAGDLPMFRALAEMNTHRIERVVVTQAGKPVGTLGLVEVLSFYANQSHLVEQQIERARSIGELSQVSTRWTPLTSALHAQGARMSHLMQAVSGLNQRLYTRLFELVFPTELRSRGCLLVLGSEGRGEQILKTDQDNALIHDGTVADEVWAGHCEAFSEALLRLGYPPCPGGIMVRNAAWRGTADHFAREIGSWRLASTPAHMMRLSILLDLRPAAGRAELAEPLIAAMTALGKDDVLLHHLARAALEFRTPLSFFGQLKADHQQLDIKKGGVFPIVQGLRTMALQQGLRPGSSYQRLQNLVEGKHIDTDLGIELRQALSAFIRLRLGQQLRKLESGQSINDNLDLSALSRLDRELLRDALAVVDRFKALIKQRFHVEG